MTPYERDPSAIDPRTQGSATRTFFSFVAIMAILFAAFTVMYLYANRETTVAQTGPSVAQTEPTAPTTTPSPAPPAAVPNPNPPPGPAPGQTVPDQGTPAEPGQPTPPGTGN